MRYIKTYEVYRPPKSYQLSDEERRIMNFANRLEYNLNKYFNFTRKGETRIVVDWFPLHYYSGISVWTFLIGTWGLIPSPDDPKVKNLVTKMQRLGARGTYGDYHWLLTYEQAEELLKEAKGKFTQLEAELAAEIYNL